MGRKEFIVPKNLSYIRGNYVIIRASLFEQMQGTVISYVDDKLTVNVDFATGFGEILI
jgi:transcription antitermination factor NusG